MKDRREINFFPLAFQLAGFALLIAGMWRIYHPAALIVAGILLYAFSLSGRSVE